MLSIQAHAIDYESVTAPVIVMKVWTKIRAYCSFPSSKPGLCATENPGIKPEYALIENGLMGLNQYGKMVVDFQTKVAFKIFYMIFQCLFLSALYFYIKYTCFYNVKEEEKSYFRF